MQNLKEQKEISSHKGACLGSGWTVGCIRVGRVYKASQMHSIDLCEDQNASHAVHNLMERVRVRLNPERVRSHLKVKSSMSTTCRVRCCRLRRVRKPLIGSDRCVRRSEFFTHAVHNLWESRGLVLTKGVYLGSEPPGVAGSKRILRLVGCNRFVQRPDGPPHAMYNLRKYL